VWTKQIHTDLLGQNKHRSVWNKHIMICWVQINTDLCERNKIMVCGNQTHTHTYVGPNKQCY